jgi:hypothetical protein
MQGGRAGQIREGENLGKLTVTVRKKSQLNKPSRGQLTTEVLIAAVGRTQRGSRPVAVHTPEALDQSKEYQNISEKFFKKIISIFRSQEYLRPSRTYT